MNTDRWISRPLEFIMYWCRLLFLAALLCEKWRENKLLHTYRLIKYITFRNFPMFYIARSIFGHFFSNSEQTVHKVSSNSLSKFTPIKQELDWKTHPWKSVLLHSSRFYRYNDEKITRSMKPWRVSRHASTSVPSIEETKSFGAI